MSCECESDFEYHEFVECITFPIAELLTAIIATLLFGGIWYKNISKN